MNPRFLLMLFPLLSLSLYGCNGDGNSITDDSDTVADDSGSENPVVSTGGYDSFDDPMIDPDNWRDLELTRAIGSLRSVLRRVGSDGSNTVEFVDPDNINSIQAQVRVEEILLDDDQTGEEHARALAGLKGYWYDDGTPGDGATGNVLAEIYLKDSGTGGLQAEYALWRCDDADCDTLTPGDRNTLAGVALGEAHTLSIVWDGGSTFTFGVNGATEVVDAGGIFPFAAPVQDSPFKGLGTRVDRLDGDDEGGYIVALFDEVMVNGLLYDDFEGEALSPDRWRQLDFKREIVAGELELELASRDEGGGRNNLTFVDPNGITAIATDVTVLKMDNRGADNPLASIAGFWYDSGLPGEGDIGEVWAEFQLRNAGAGLEPRVEVFQCTNANCLEGNLLYEDTTSFGSVEIGQTFRLSIVWDGSQFTFALDDSTVVFDPRGLAPVAGAPQSPWKAMRLRIFDDETGFAHIRARFDNVDVERPQQ